VVEGLLVATMECSARARRHMVRFRGKCPCRRGTGEIWRAERRGWQAGRRQ